jgi:hypothetical protein
MDGDVAARNPRVTLLIVEEKKSSSASSHTSWTCTQDQYGKGNADRVKIMKMMRRQLEHARVADVYGLQWVGRQWYIYRMSPVTKNWALMEVVDQGCVINCCLICFGSTLS